MRASPAIMIRARPSLPWCLSVTFPLDACGDDTRAGRERCPSAVRAENGATQDLQITAEPCASRRLYGATYKGVGSGRVLATACPLDEATGAGVLSKPPIARKSINFPEGFFDRGIASTLHATGRQEASRVLEGLARRESSNATGPKQKRTNAISSIFGVSHGDFRRRRSVATRSVAPRADRTGGTSLERCVEGGDVTGER